MPWMRAAAVRVILVALRERRTGASRSRASEAVEQDDELLESLDLAELLLSAVCDEYEVSEDGTNLHVVKRTAGQDAR